MVDYKTLGLVNTREMFKRAINGGYAIPAFNFNNMEQLQAIIKASSDLKSPVILQVSKGARNYANATPCCAIWHRVLWSMPRSWVALILRLLSTLTMVIASRLARAVSTTDSLL